MDGRDQAKNFAALFDTQFSPETETAPAFAWRALAPSTDPKRIGAMDLLAALGGEQRVAYTRTWIHSETETPVVLEMGSDDGIKVWVNDSLLFEHDVTRGAGRNQERVTLPLRRGDNALLMKISNGGGPTGFVFSFSPYDPEVLWSLLGRDFTAPDERQQMSWEREDDIWSVEWTRKNKTQLAHPPQARFRLYCFES